LHAQRAKLVEAVTLLFKGAQSAEIQIGERAGVIGLHRLHQRDVDGRVAPLDVFRCGSATESASDDHHFAGGTLGERRCHEQSGACRAGLAHACEPLTTGKIDGRAHCLATSAREDVSIVEKCWASAASCWSLSPLASRFITVVPA